MSRRLLRGSLLFVLCLLAPVFSALADPQIQAAQQTLKDEGIYFGEVDGQPGKETESAIRRYQIRHGLDVTGQINTETRTAMGMGSARPSPTPDRAPDQTATEEDQAFLERENTASPYPAPSPAATPYVTPGVSENTPTTAPPTASARQRTPNSFAEVFRGSPYQNAPLQTQQIVVRDAQTVLARWGFYRARVDGVPGPAMRQAIAEAQRQSGLRPTGRLDAPILARMRMMPYPHTPVFKWFNSLFGSRPPGR